MEKKVNIGIGRASGPCTDKFVNSEFDENQIDLIRDIIAMVNAVGNNKEKWYVVINQGKHNETQFLPVVNV